MSRPQRYQNLNFEMVLSSEVSVLAEAVTWGLCQCAAWGASLQAAKPWAPGGSR